MAFQNKGASIFEYGSHLPLIRLSGYTLCIELLIKKYLESINDDERYSNLLLFLFNIINDNSITEISFNDLLNKIQNEIPQIGQEIAKNIYNQIERILKDDNTDLFSFFEHKLKPLIPKDKDININNNETYHLSKCSLLGIFHRKLMICYNHSSFSTLNKFLKNIQDYFDKGISTIHSFKEEKKDKDDDDDDIFSILNNLKYPYEIDDKLYKLAKNNNHIQKEKDFKLFSMISDKFPDLPSTHYLNAMENMRNGEYISSLSYLHKYFDFVASSFKINWNNIINNRNKHNKINQKQYQSLLQEKRKKMQYSLLCRATFYAYFGHYNLAIQQITEALQRAQNIGDRECVSSALYLLVEFLSDQSGNCGLIKQIYENCIQNTSAMSSVHIGSLIGLSKWNLYHISIYNTKSRPWFLFEYFYYAQKMIALNNKYKYFGEILFLKGNAWNLYGNKSLSSISYQTFLINHLNISKNDNILYTNIANYFQYHLKYQDSMILLKDLINNNKKNIILEQMSLILLLKQSINCNDLKMASIYQIRLAELIPSAKDNFFLYLEMMYLHSQIRYQYEQYMEASQILNNLISICNQRSLQSITIPYYLFLSKIHLKCHGEVTMIMEYVLKAWSICKSYHFYYWLPECTIFLSKLHLKLNNIKQSLNLIQRYLPIILKKNNHLIIESYIILAKCCIHNNQSIAAIKYLHIARIWCNKLMQNDKAFKQSYIINDLFKEIYYFLARIYQHINDKKNRDKSAQKMFDIIDNDS